MLEAHENYQKQSWRNRCNILTANGIEALQVPVVHDGGTFRHPISEIRVVWSRPWLERQKRALDSAYMSSAYFEHYRDALYAVLDERPERLWDLNLSVINFFLRAFGHEEVSPTGLATLTEEFSPRTPVPGTPLRFVWNRPPRKFWSDSAVKPVGLTM
ncbi:MAG: WbqC family protein, partial [Bacteroidales bacterium]|nr:WbqC family protein [Bacteroidales bacterium]